MIWDSSDNPRLRGGSGGRGRSRSRGWRRQTRRGPSLWDSRVTAAATLGETLPLILGCIRCITCPPKVVFRAAIVTCHNVTGLVSRISPLTLSFALEPATPRVGIVTSTTPWAERTITIIRQERPSRALSEPPATNLLSFSFSFPFVAHPPGLAALSAAPNVFGHDIVHVRLLHLSHS